MLLHSYYDFSYVRTRPVRIIDRLLIKAVEKRDRNEMWDVWLAKYPDMTKENFIDFETFWSRRFQSVREPGNTGESVEDTFKRLIKGVSASARHEV